MSCCASSLRPWLVSPLSASLRGFQRLSDAHRAGCPRRWAGGRLWPCKRARNAVEAVCETPRPPALWIPRGNLGFSGAWIGNLTVLEPYRPLFIGAALVALFFAWKRIYRPVQACKPGEVCAIPQVRATYKLIFWIVAVLVLVALGFPYVVPFFY